MENQFVNFKIIVRNNKGNRYRWLSLAAIILTVCLTLFYHEPPPAVFTVSVFCSMLVLVFIFGIKLQLLQEYDEAGWLMLTYNSIVIRVETGEVEYPIDKNTSLSLELRGYSGEPVIGQTFGDKKGYNNFITLSHNDMAVRHEILISNKMKILIMDRLLGHYRRSGVKVIYNDRSAVDSKNALLIRLLLAFRHFR